MSSSFVVNQADLAKILKEIKIAEETSIAYTPATAPKTILQAIMDAYGVTAANAAQLPAGLRTVDGTFNNLLPGSSTTGAADTLFPRLTNPVFLNDQDGDTMSFGPPGSGAPVITNTNYGVLPSGQVGSVADADPRIISNLIVDMSLNNPAAAQAFLNNPLAVARFKEANGGVEPFYTYSYTTGGSPFDPTAQTLVYQTNLTNADLQTLPNQSPDIGLSPSFNSWMTYFGQFFDHGLDLVTKGGNGTVYIPLQPDDPLYVPGSPTNFMVLTRATATIDANGVPQHKNTTTPWIDQNQTYTSHASHQVFLREYVMTSTGAVSTGKLLDGAVAGTISNWGEVKAQALTMLGIQLNDFDIHNVPLLLTDQYGKFIPGPNGYAQLVMAPDATHPTNWLKEGTAAGITTEGSIGTNHAFLDDIAHSASPGFWDHDGDPSTPKVRQTADTDTSIGGPQAPGTYDDELLNAHFITGDGRGNENIALTAVHSVFHSEHNRVVDANKITILKSGDLAFLNEWLAVDVASLPVIPAGASDADIKAIANTLVWDGERLFQAARFSTEMQYQHLVFEEFARRIQPMVDPFVFNNSPEIDPAITAEFAHTVYRFGHSMLTGTVDRLDNNLNLLNGDQSQQTLLAMFLNPQAYLDSGVDAATINANLIRGLTRDVGNSMDEMIVVDVRSQLLGLALDLGALNIARGRDTGIPSLNETRRQLYNSSGLADLKPYTSWVDFAANIKNATAIINFIAAYGTHATITAQTTLIGKRAAAEALVFGGPGAPADRLDFLNATGAYAGGTLGGLNTVDLWIGGLAEANPEFGGMLGSTFNYVFEAQMENLQNGDRLYYLSRTQGMNLLNQLEPNTFTDLVMRNTALGDKYATHLSGSLFITPDLILELDRGIAQTDYNPTNAPGNDPDDVAGLDPIGASLFTPKVQRDYTNSIVVDGNHDFGGTLRFTGGEHVVIGGTEGNDILTSDKGDDTLWGDGGNDYINGGAGADNVFGGEGDDIIEDPFGDDVLRGAQGNDVITSARGLDLIFGDQGSDYIVLGQDASEAFGGLDNDFILGGSGGDFLLGNEGDDWIEGAGGFDTLAGDNSELFFNSPIIGHDVLFGQGDEVDYDAESGDDIMGSGSSVFRYEGMFGFDWGIAKHDNSAIRFDLNLNLIVTGTANDVLRDRFDNVEALSGWQNNDELFGDNRGHVAGSAPLAFNPAVFADPQFFSAGANGEVTVDNLLNNEGVDRITGFRAWFGGAATTLGTVAGSAPTDTFFRDGNILMGGDGSDTIMGRGGFDIIDGDAWLNVRIKIVIPSGPNAGTYSAESMNTDTTVMGPHAGKVFNTNPDGSPNFSSPAFGGRSLTSLMLDRTINPGQMSVVREILYDNTNVTGPNKNIDTAVYQGNFADYEIEGVNQTGQATDLNGDGFIYVRDLDNGVNRPPVVDPVTGATARVYDDTDLIKNIERLQFADRIFRLDTTPPSDIQWNGVTPTNALPGAGATIANLSTTDDDTSTGFVYSLVVAGSSAGFAVSAAGVVTTTAALVAGTTYTLNIRSTDTTGGARTETFIINAGTTAIDTITATSTDTIVYGNTGNDTLNGGTGNDNLFGQAGNDTLNGGAGNDILVGGAGTDTVNGGAGNDTIRHAVGDGGGSVDGGADSDTLQITGNATDQSLAVTFNGTSLTNFDGGTVTNVESVTLDLGAGVDTLVYTAPGGVTVNLGTGTGSGFTSITGVENVTGNGGNDAITGDGNANVLNGGGGNDTLNGGGGADTLTGGAGADTLNGDAGIDTVVESGNVNFTLTNTSLVGNGTDTLSGIEQVTLTGGAGANTLDASAFTAGTVTLDGGGGNDTLTGGTGADTLDGGAGVDTLTGGAGADTLTGGAGNDSLNGGADIDTVVESGNVNFTLTNTSLTGNGTDTLSSIEQVILTGGGGANTLNASAFTAGVVTLDGAGGADTLIGGTGNDTLIGGTGADTLTGGAGNDTLTGGTGNDNFLFAPGFGTDLITDFDANPAAGGQDLLDLRGYTGVNDITPTNFASLVTISLGSGNTTVTIGTDTITLLGVTGVGANAITAADFILD